MRNRLVFTLGYERVQILSRGHSVEARVASLLLTGCEVCDQFENSILVHYLLHLQRLVVPRPHIVFKDLQQASLALIKALHFLLRP